VSSAPEEEPPDAVELAPPGVAEPEPRVLVYATGHKPVVQVWVGGEWRTGVVRERHDYPNGTVYRVILDPGTGRL
jgi:hypothetical protein